VTATEVPVADPAPFVAALRSYAEDGLVPFSCPGPKRGQGAAGEPRALLGDGVFDRDLHRSLLVGLILTGARPGYVAPRAHPELGLGLGGVPAGGGRSSHSG
jgi:arginine/lysine/ornithine decarboxylase